MLCFGLPIAVVALALAGTADAGIIVGWTFDDSTRNPAVTDAHVTASTFDSNDGSVTFAAGNPSTGKSIVDDNWKTPGNYFYFTVDPTSGFMLNLDSLTFDDMKESSLGTDYQISYRVGSSGGFSPGGSGTIHSSFATTPMNTVSLSGISALQGIAQATTFRILAVGGSNDAKKWYLDNVALNGGAVPVPEPAPLSLLALGGLLLALIRRRRAAHRLASPILDP